jgi:hypothetical protein
VIGSIRFVGRVAGSTESMARLERLLAILGRAAHVSEEARIARAVELLPERHLGLLRRIAETADLPGGASLDALRAALAAERDLAAGVDELRDVLAVAARIEAKAAEAGGVTSRTAEGFHALLAHSPWDRAEMIDLLDRVPAARLDEFLHTMTFVRPEHFSRFGLQAFRELAEHPRAMALVREAGSGLLDTAFGASGRSWEGLERFLDGLAARRARGADPAEYQRLLDRLARGDAAAFEEVADARHAEQVAEAARAGQTAEYGLSRLRRGRHDRVIETLDEMAEEGSHAARSEYASRLARLTDKELDGLEQVARWEPSNAPHDWRDILDTLHEWNPAARSDFLRVMADVGPHTTAGLDDVLSSIFARSVDQAGADLATVQGGLGQLYAGRTLIERYGARNLRFEITEITDGLRRDVDILIDSASGPMRVEVKTNLGGVPSFDEGQILKDLAGHASTHYNGLLYLYHPSVPREALQHVGARMLDLFDGPELQRLLRSRGIDGNRTRWDLQQWLSRGGVAHYDL